MVKTSRGDCESVVLIVLNSFTNDSRVLKEARTLLAAGYKVSVCAMHEGGLPEYEDLNGVEVYRINIKTRSWPKVRAIQLIKYAEFVVKTLFRFRKFNIFHCNDLNALPIGVLAKMLFRGKKVLYDAHEYEIHTSARQSQKSIDRLFRFEKFCIGYADAVTMTGEADAVAYEKMYGIERPRIVMNCPPYQEMGSTKNDYFRKTFDIAEDRAIFLFHGVLFRNRGIPVMLEAFEKFNGSDKCIVFMGYGEMVDAIQHHAALYDSIYYHEAVPPDELAGFTNAADCGIIFMKNECTNYNYALPNKLFEYCMARIPTLSTPLQETSRIIKEYNLGFVVDGYTADELYDAVNSSSAADLDAFYPSLDSAAKALCWEEQEKVLLEAYASLA